MDARLKPLASILSINAASAALTISGIPFDGPIGTCRVGYVDGEYILNPVVDDMQDLRNNPDQRLDLVVAGTKDAVMMVESEAYELSEAEMLGAVNFAHQQIQPVIDRYQNESRRLCEVLDRRLGESEWLADDYSIADIANWCWVRTYKWSGLDLDDLTNLKRWRDAIRERPAAQKGIEVPQRLFNAEKDEEAAKAFDTVAEYVSRWSLWWLNFMLRFIAPAVFFMTYRVGLAQRF